MTDKEKSKYGVEFVDLDNLQKRVSIRKDVAYLLQGYAGSPITFQLLASSKIDKDLPVGSIRCRIKCGYVPLQVVEIKEGDSLSVALSDKYAQIIRLKEREPFHQKLERLSRFVMF